MSSCVVTNVRNIFIYYDINCVFKSLIKVICWAVIFITRIVGKQYHAKPFQYSTRKGLLNYDFFFNFIVSAITILSEYPSAFVGLKYS